MVNIKLDKTGGLTEALALRDAARAAGFGVMVGCMVGSSLAMAPAVLVAQGAAFTDLDGPLLLARDRRARAALRRAGRASVRRPSSGGEMSRIVYVNGAYLPEEEAKISVFDRGFLFADAVYEVTSVLDGKLVDFAGHLRAAAPLARRARDAGAGSTTPASRRSTASWSRATRSPRAWSTCRSPAAPPTATSPSRRTPAPSLVLFTQARPLVDTAAARDGIKVIAVPDIRWAPARHQDGAAARAVDVQDDGEEGRQGRRLDGRGRLRHRGHLEQRLDRHRATAAIVTRDLSEAILHGITRAAVLRLRRARRRSGSRSGRSRWPRRRRRRRPSSPPPRPSSPRWSRSTAGRSATAGPGR